MNGNFVLTNQQGEVFINGARFIQADIDTASNGILHIIDRIFLEDALTSNAYRFITDKDTSGISDSTRLVYNHTAIFYFVS